MSKRYVKEFINDWINHYSADTTNDIADGAKQFGNRVLKEYERGHITSLEAVKMVSGMDAWELSNGRYKDRFLNW